MHVRIAWEILNHQKKENPEKTVNAPNLSTPKTAASEMRPPSHIFSSANMIPRPHELPTGFPASLAGRQFEAAQLPPGFLAGPTSHLGMKMNLIKI